MSKTITIPEGIMNPFVVGHNGITYTYKPGETVEVPDGVALEIEKIAHWDDKFRAPVTPPIGIDAVLAEAKEYTDSQRLAYEETRLKRVCELGTGENTTVQHTFSVGDKVTVTVTPILVDLGYLEWYGISTDFKKTVEVVVTADSDGECLAMEYNMEQNTSQGICFHLLYRESIFVAAVCRIYSEKENYWCPWGSVAVDVDTTTVHTIEPKYLPGVCLPMLDICGFYGGDVTDEKTIQFLNEVANSELPFILKFELNGHTRSTFMHYCGYGEQSVVYESVQYSDMTTIRSNSDGVWNIYISAGA